MQPLLAKALEKIQASLDLTLKRNGFKKMMNKIPKISGKLIQGAQKAAFFAGLPWVKQQCQKKIGFVPFPGTLNIEINSSQLKLLKNIADHFWEELIPPDDNFCASKVLPISVKNIKCAVILPEADVNIHHSHVIKILAPIKLRTELGLDDFLTIKLK